jgi:rubrerythrin
MSCVVATRRIRLPGQLHERYHRVDPRFASLPSPRIPAMKKTAYDSAQVNELLYQALETELGGVQVYETALKCAINDDLRKEWQEYLKETRTHVDVVTRVFQTLGLDTEAVTPGREVVRHQGQSLVKAMKMALEAGDADAAQLVACECVVLAETKDHSNWELIGHVVKHGKGDAIDVLKSAYEAVEDDEDHHLYHTKGWCRELWIQSLGFPAVLPPPEEVKQVETAIGAARAEQSRDQMPKH